MMSSYAPHFCDHCGAANRSTGKFCAVCGLSLTGGPVVASGDALTSAQVLKGRYQILETIGQGGFGTIYKAEDLTFHHAVRAIKEIRVRHLTPSEEKEAVEAFKGEASLLAGLMHPHLPRIYDHFEDHGNWYLVMDFIDGETLGQRLRGAGGVGLEPQETIQFALQLCSVLNYLHNRQPPVIFRDLKPSNVMVTDDEHLYLIDFGIARLFKPGQVKDTLALGSPGYAAPEQYGKAQTTVRADVYSLGATLHHLLSARDPSDDPFDFPPLKLEQYPQIGPALAQLIQQMVAMSREQRPENVQVVRQELQRLALLAVSAGPALQVAGPAGTAMAQAGGFKKGDFVEGEITGIEQNKLLVKVDGGIEGMVPLKEVPLSGEGAFATWQVGDQILLYVMQPKIGSDPLLLSFKRADTERRWRAVEERYKRGETLTAKVIDYNKRAFIVDVQGLRGSVPFSKMLSLKGREISDLEEVKNKELTLKIVEIERKVNRLLLAEEAVGNVVKVASTPPTIAPVTKMPPVSATPVPPVSAPVKVTPVPPVSAPVNVPSPPHVTIASMIPGVAGVQRVMPVPGKTVHIFDGHTERITSVCWSPDGTRVASASEDCSVRIWDTRKGGEALLVYKDHSKRVECVAWSSDGKWIVSSDSNNGMRVWHATTGKLHKLYNCWASSVKWSPDNKRLASAGVGNDLKIWDMAIEGMPVHIYSGVNRYEWLRSLAWSPDSQLIAAGGKNGKISVWDARKLGEPLVTYNGHEDSVWSIVWSPDGSRLASGAGKGQVKIWDTRTKGIGILTYQADSHAVYSVAWSPDGRHLVSGGIQSGIKVWNAQRGGDAEFVYAGHTRSVKSLAWSPDGTRIVSGGDDKTVQIWRV